ncbi:hypothetical protein ACOME3_002030 [Neoechinorhynchus agilis]
MSANRLKTNLKLTAQRLRLLERKKTENGLKARHEIAEYLKTGKVDRARIRVEHIIREDYCVEAMEILEIFCETLLTRFDVFLSTKDAIGSGLEEVLSSLLWAASRMESEVPELKKVREDLTRILDTTGPIHTVSEKLVAKMNVEAVSRLLIEQYLVEIAKSNHVKFSPDPGIMAHDNHWNLGKRFLIDFEEASAPTSLSNSDDADTLCDLNRNECSKPTTKDAQVQTLAVRPPPSEQVDVKSDPSTYNTLYPTAPVVPNSQSTPTQHLGFSGTKFDFLKSDHLSLPSVPNTQLPQQPLSNRELGLDFDELNKRFEELRKRR